MAKRSTSKRERLDTPTGSHFAKSDAKGQFKEMDNVGRSLAADRRKKAKSGEIRARGSKATGRVRQDQNARALLGR